MKAKIESEDYKLTENFLNHARVDNGAEAAPPKHDPSKIEKAKKIVHSSTASTENYIKT